MVEMLGQHGVLRPDANEQPPIGIARCLADFDHHLDQVRGNAPRTRKIYLWYARGMLGGFCLSVSEPKNLTGRR
jgi:hypothetical protein